MRAGEVPFCWFKPAALDLGSVGMVSLLWGRPFAVVATIHHAGAADRLGPRAAVLHKEMLSDEAEEV